MALARQASTSSEADLEENAIDYSQYEEHDQSNVSSFAASPLRNGGGGGSTASLDDETPGHLQAIEQAMSKLKQVHAAKDWEKVLKHKHGVNVFVKKDIVDLYGKTKKVPLFKGEKVIEGFQPAEVFNVAARGDLWDEWYDSGELVADLIPGTSLTYMNMKVNNFGTNRSRDMALVERVDISTDGTIWFAATSVESNKVPHVSGRARGHMVLNGWVLRPVEKNGRSSTFATYYVQFDTAGFLPNAIATKLVSRRPIAIYKIEKYLRKRGPVREVTYSDEEQAADANSSFVSGASSPLTPTRAGTAVPAAAVAGAIGAATALPAHVKLNEKHSSTSEIQSAKQTFESLLKEKNWSKAKDSKGFAIYQKNSGSGLPIVRGEATIRGSITTEQVLATILSKSAKRIWDQQFEEFEFLESINGYDQIIYKDTRKAIYPHIDGRSYTLAQAVIREDQDSENGPLTLLSRSIESDSKQGGVVEVSGWQLRPISDDAVEITHITKADVKAERSFPDFIERILISAEAAVPTRVKLFVEEFGHAPYFQRWGPGSAVLLGEVEGDIENGQVGWKIGSGESPSSSDPQIVWLQWSEKMYPKGISLEIEPAASAKPVRVDGFDNVLQLTFTNKVPESGISITASRNNASHPSDVSVNGHKVTEVTARPLGAAAHKRAQPKKTAPAEATPTPDTHEPSTTEEVGQSLIPAAAIGSLGAAIPAKETLQSIPKAAADLATVHRPPKLEDGRRALPDDAMLIITKDLYFTRSQMAVVTGLLAIVWAVARYT